LAELAHALRRLGRVGLAECLGLVVLEGQVRQGWEAGERVVVRAPVVGVRQEVLPLVKD
jgi:hypothetical protein